jgi:hypothetical protein
MRQSDPVKRNTSLPMKAKTSCASFFGAVLFAAAFAPSVVSATLLVGFNDFKNLGPGNTIVQSEGSLGGSMTGNAGASGGSKDGFYGPDSTALGGVPLANAPTTLNGRLNANNATLTVTNTTGKTFVLTSLLFDAIKNANNAGIASYTVAWKVDNVPTGSATGTYDYAEPANPNLFNDYMIALGGILLAPNSVISFLWTSTTGAQIDNIALLGIPEPGSLLALGCLVGSGVFLRSRSRRKVAA